MPPHRIAYLALAALLGGALAACQTMPATSMLALSRVDPFELTAADIEAAMVHPPELRFSDGAAVLTLDAADPSRGLEGRQTFLLDVDTTADAIPYIDRPRGALLTRFRVADNDAARFNGFMAMLRRYRDMPTVNAGAEKGSFSISLNGRPCRVGDDAGPLPVTAYLKARADGRLRPVTRGLDLATDAGDVIPSCGV